MNRILILTKNILADKELEKILRSLNYEAFASRQLFECFLKNGKKKGFDDWFQMIIFSKTLNNAEVLHILKGLSHTDCICLREDNEYPEKRQEDYWRSKGLSGWLSLKDSHQELRERLCRFHKVEEFYTHSNFVVEKGGYALEILIKRLSKNEKAILKILYDARDVFLTREQIAKLMWPNGNMSSRTSQVAQLIQKLRQRFVSCGFDKDMIVTNWGIGYQLNEQFYEMYESQMLQDNKFEKVIITN